VPWFGRKGNGQDATYAADLTDDLRIELKTEGVLFYKIWNGRIKQGKGPTQDRGEAGAHK
jgi:hypothetical protein